MILAEIIADSMNPAGHRLTTFLLTYPRFIHSEFMTHRAFSRNAASSRAIPISKMIEAIETVPAWPEQWGGNKPGMQAGEEVDAQSLAFIRQVLGSMKGDAVAYIQSVSAKGLHKQVANRYLEPWAHITVIATASDFGLNNFFALRAHPMAQPEFQVLAYRMLAKYMGRAPNIMPWGGWHIPFAEGDYECYGMERINPIIQAAVGRCARVSYSRHDEEDAAKNIELHNRLAQSGHWSPFEHVAQAVNPDFPNPLTSRFDRYPWSNFDRPGDGGPSGWGQYRKLFPGENVAKPDFTAIMAAKPGFVTV